jgi:hypothetical protein
LHFYTDFISQQHSLHLFIAQQRFTFFGAHTVVPLKLRYV